MLLSETSDVNPARGIGGTSIVLFVADRDIRIVDADGELLLELVLDPTRDYQRQSPDVSDVSTNHTVELRGVEPLTS